MAIKTYKPTSPGKRNHVSVINTEISKKRPEKSLLRPLAKTGGRNNYGRMTSRHIGGGHKRKYRLIDFKRNKVEIKNAVEKLFNVKVGKVRTTMVRGKQKRVGRHFGRAPDWKKAIVTLSEGKINFLEEL